MRFHLQPGVRQLAVTLGWFVGKCRSRICEGVVIQSCIPNRNVWKVACGSVWHSTWCTKHLTHWKQPQDVFSTNRSARIPRERQSLEAHAETGRVQWKVLWWSWTSGGWSSAPSGTCWHCPPSDGQHYVPFSPQANSSTVSLARTRSAVCRPNEEDVLFLHDSIPSVNVTSAHTRSFVSSSHQLLVNGLQHTAQLWML